VSTPASQAYDKKLKLHVDNQYFSHETSPITDANAFNHEVAAVKNVEKCFPIEDIYRITALHPFLTFLKQLSMSLVLVVYVCYVQ